MSKSKRRAATIIAAAAIFAVTIGIIIHFTISEEHLQISHENERLKENTLRNSTIVENLLAEYSETLRALALYIKDYGDLTSDESIALLRDMAEAFDFDRLYIDFADGKSYTSDGVICNMDDDPYLSAVKAGEAFITDVVTSALDGTPRIRIHVPLVPGESTLSFSMPLEQVRESTQALLPDKYRLFYIVDSNGLVVSTNIETLIANSRPFSDILDRAVFNEGYSKEEMFQAYLRGEEGYVEYSVTGEERYVYYAPVGINNWMLYTVMPSEYIYAGTQSFVSRALALCLQIALILIAVACIVFAEQRRQKIISELDTQCFRILAEYTGRVILEWDHENKELHMSNFEKVFNRKNLSLDHVINFDHKTSDEVHPEDSEIFRQMGTDIVMGKNIDKIQFRLLDGAGKYVYHSLSAVVVTHANGRPYKTLGFIESIDEQLRREENLRRKAETDQLTGFYNKAAAENVIASILENSPPTSSHALICLDLDNFKGVNDAFGHLYGDKVLTDLSESLKKMFRKADVLGRFGGDEFVVFLPNVPGKAFVEEKAAELNSAVHRTYSQDGASESVSASIGIAMFPQNGRTYKALYEAADEASYKVKNCGKNSYAFSHDKPTTE